MTAKNTRIMHRTAHRFGVALTGASVIAGALLIPSTMASAAGMAPADGQSGDSGLTVSVPPSAIPIHPGQDSSVSIRVINQGADPVNVTLSDRGAELGDNGAVRLSDQEDPLWAGRVTLPAGELTIPGKGYQTVTVQVHAPEAIDPDLYFMGLMVTPAASKAGSVQVVNQIGTLISFDVPGPRSQELSAGMDASPFQVAGTAAATLQVHNPGHSVLRFFGETDTADSAQPARIDTSILPVGRERSLPVTAKADWPVQLVTLNARLSYSDQTASATTEVTATTDVWLIQPWVPIAAAVALFLGAAALAFRRIRAVIRRKRAAVAAPEVVTPEVAPVG